MIWRQYGGGFRNSPGLWGGGIHGFVKLPGRKPRNFSQRFRSAIMSGRLITVKTPLIICYLIRIQDNLCIFTGRKMYQKQSRCIPWKHSLEERIGFRL